MNTHAQIMIRPHTTQSATESARQVLTLLSDYAVRNELEQFFKREWEIATGAAEFREAFELRENDLEERLEERIKRFHEVESELNDLRKSARHLIDAMHEADLEEISRCKNHIKSLL